MKFSLKICAFIAVAYLLGSCNKFLPTSKAALGDDALFTQTLYQPVLGRATLYNTFSVGASTTQPLTFAIINPRRKNGEPAPELTDVFPVTVWKTAYTGTETSLAQINAERDTEMHHLFEIRPSSGQFVMWPEASSSFVKSLPDSGYIFDVEMSNSGGRKYFRNFQLIPYRERPYEPSNLDPITGQATVPYIYPGIVSNIDGVTSGEPMTSSDIEVFFYKTGDGNSLTFKFLDTLQNNIDPHKFNLTNWNTLVHGFNMKMNTDSVTYQVAYPIPLTTLPTQYTTADGSQAIVIFQWARQGYANLRVVGSLGLAFNIYQKGDWQIIFWFKNDNPKFDND